MSQATDNFPVYMKTMTNADNWQANFEILKAHVAQTGHFPKQVVLVSTRAGGESLLIVKGDSSL